MKVVKKEADIRFTINTEWERKFASEGERGWEIGLRTG